MSNIKIERIKSKKKITIGSFIFISIIVALVLITSKAKYKNVQSIDLASGTINYIPADIDIVAIYQENDAGEYVSVDAIPASEYVLSNTSYCNVNGEKDTSIKITYENGLVGINDITKRTKCTLYFDKYSAIYTIIGDTTNIEEKTEFTGIATASDTGIYSAPDDYGTSYYFRGLEGSLNNWVKFADSYWRIIRINGNGTVRMIYSGAANGNPSSSNKTGATTQIGSSMFNHTYNDNAYVGYMMGIPLNGTDQTKNETANNSTSYEQAHTNIYDSDSKKAIDNWYQKNIANNENYAKQVDANTGFCNDRQINNTAFNGISGAGYSTKNTGYAPAGRLMNSGNFKIVQTPILQCENKTRDLFAHTSANDGNKKLTYPVGLITSDEVVFAGGFGGKDNNTYYLYTSQAYWTMSPSHGGNAGVFVVVENGVFGGTNIFNTLGLRPVINLRADTHFTGDGSETNPFVVA